MSDLGPDDFVKVNREKFIGLIYDCFTNSYPELTEEMIKEYVYKAECHLQPKGPVAMFVYNLIREDL